MGKFVMCTLLKFDGETEEEYRYVEVLPRERDPLKLGVGPVLVSKNVLGRNPPRELTLILEEESTAGQVELAE